MHGIRNCEHRCGTARVETIIDWMNDGIGNAISQNVFIDSFEKDDSPTESSTYCLLLLIETFSYRLCGEGDFSNLINKDIVTDKLVYMRTGNGSALHIITQVVSVRT